MEAALKLPPAHTRKAGGPEQEELAQLRAQIESDQRLLIQFAEEKVQLAVQVRQGAAAERRGCLEGARRAAVLPAAVLRGT